VGQSTRTRRVVTVCLRQLLPRSLELLLGVALLLIHAWEAANIGLSKTVRTGALSAMSGSAIWPRVAALIQCQAGAIALPVNQPGDDQLCRATEYGNGSGVNDAEAAAANRLGD
jgi:hypothetical protein